MKKKQEKKEPGIASVTSLGSRLARSAPIVGVRAGWIVDEDEAGVPHVDFEGNRWGPLPARSLFACSAEPDKTVALAFENEDPLRPVIVGVPTARSSSPEESNGTGDVFEIETMLPNEPHRVFVDGHEVCILPGSEFELRCGESRLIVQRDGKAILRSAEFELESPEME